MYSYHIQYPLQTSLRSSPNSLLNVLSLYLEKYSSICISQLLLGMEPALDCG